MIEIFKRRTQEEIETLKKLIPIGTIVTVLEPADSKDGTWLAVPDGSPVPEGYEAIGRGEVTDINRDDTRSLEGANPLVVQWYMYMGVNEEDWKNKRPEEDK